MKLYEKDANLEYAEFLPFQPGRLRKTIWREGNLWERTFVAVPVSPECGRTGFVPDMRPDVEIEHMI
jgi:hypothetical protein